MCNAVNGSIERVSGAIVSEMAEISGSVTNPLRIDNVQILDSDATPTNGFGEMESIMTEDGPAKYYDMNGFEVAKPVAGSIYIVKYTSGKMAKVVK